MPWTRQRPSGRLLKTGKTEILKLTLNIMKKKPSYQELEFKIQELESKLEFTRKKAEIANEAKIEFMANMSHELRTPMHAIINYTKFGIHRHKSAGKEKLLHYFLQIQSSAKRMMDLLSNLLTLLDYDAGLVKLLIEPKNIVEIAKKTADEFKDILEQKQLEVDYSEFEGIKLVNCDEQRIIDLLRNLLSNAIKFSPPQKKISLVFQPATQSGKSIDEDSKESAAVLVSIQDQGPGIPENELQYLFKRFTQSSRTNTGCGGSGIGLAICEEIVTAHGGRIWSQNLEEGGAAFTFVLPYYPI